MAWLGDLGSAILGTLYANIVVVVAIGAVGIVALAVVARRVGWLHRARRHPRRAAGVVAVGLAIAVPIGWYLASPLVLSASVDEPPPVVADRPSPTPVAVGTPVAPGATPRSSPDPTAVPTPPPLERSGSFHGSDDFHFGRGMARLIETAPGTFIVRLEDFAVRNGPDLYVYLSPDATGYARDAIELGRLKADRGNQNYAVPDGALRDPSRAASVVIWCKQFSHLFATARLGG